MAGELDKVLAQAKVVREQAFRDGYAEGKTAARQQFFIDLMKAEAAGGLTTLTYTKYEKLNAAEARMMCTARTEGLVKALNETLTKVKVQLGERGHECDTNGYRLYFDWT